MMRIIKVGTFSFLLTLFLANSALAKVWQNIRPLSSTRLDVRRVLGEPIRSSPNADYYSLANEIAVVWYQTASCDKEFGKFGSGWMVPAGTVTSIGIIPKANDRREKYLPDNTFTTIVGGGFAYFVRESEGLSVETYDGILTSITFAPTENERLLRCFRSEVSSMENYLPSFDQVEHLSSAEDEARLDSYAVQLNQGLDRGVISVYADTADERVRMISEAERAKEYLTKKHGIESRRILIVDGGYSQDQGIKLSFHPIGLDLASRIFILRAIEFPLSEAKLD